MRNDRRVTAVPPAAAAAVSSPTKDDMQQQQQEQEEEEHSLFPPSPILKLVFFVALFHIFIFIYYFTCMLGKN